MLKLTNCANFAHIFCKVETLGFFESFGHFRLCLVYAESSLLEILKMRNFSPPKK